MAYTLSLGSAAKGGEVALADNTILMRGQQLTVNSLTTDQLAAQATGLININPPPPTFTQASKVTITNNVGGTAPVVAVNGNVTFAAVTDIPTATNAIRGIVNQLQLISNDHSNVLTQLAQLQAEIADLAKRIAVKG